MTPEEKLELLLNAERAEAPTRAHLERGFERLQQALAANVPPLDIGPVDPTLLGASAGAGKLVTLAWVAKVTAVVGVVATTGALVGHVRSSAEPASSLAIPKAASAVAAASGSALAGPALAGPALAQSPARETGSALPPAPGVGGPRYSSERPAPDVPPERATTDSAQRAPAEATSESAIRAPEAHVRSVTAFDDVPTSEATPPQPAFDAELVLIKRAKAEFDRGRDDLARGWLSEHARRFPAGVFAAEREGLLVLSTCRSNPAAGQAAARAFLRRYPQSPLAARIQGSCGFE